MRGKKKLLILHCYCVYHRGNFYADYPEYVKIFEAQLKKSFSGLTNGDYDVLIISGGYTKPEIEKSEARGMLDWAGDLGLWPAEKGLILLEEYAIDSFENILFSLGRFYQFFGEFPASVASCTWKFNIERFEILARKLGLSHYQVLPVGRRVGEEIIAQKWAELAKKDPLYCRQADSKEKYLRRNPWKRNHPYYQISPAFRLLFAALSEIKTKRGSLKEIKNILPWK